LLRQSLANCEDSNAGQREGLAETGKKSKAKPAKLANKNSLISRQLEEQRNGSQTQDVSKDERPLKSLANSCILMKTQAHTETDTQKANQSG